MYAVRGCVRSFVAIVDTRRRHAASALQGKSVERGRIFRARHALRVRAQSVPHGNAHRRASATYCLRSSAALKRLLPPGCHAPASRRAPRGSRLNFLLATGTSRVDNSRRVRRHPSMTIGRKLASARREGVSHFARPVRLRRTGGAVESESPPGGRCATQGGECERRRRTEFRRRA